MKPKLYRQGDVLIERIEKMPENLKLVPRENDRIVLAHGEVTGHAHAISDPTATLYSTNGTNATDRLGGITYLDATGTLTLRHEEHAPITLEPGSYKITRQREYTPRGSRRVAD